MGEGSEEVPASTSFVVLQDLRVHAIVLGENMVGALVHWVKAMRGLLQPHILLLQDLRVPAVVVWEDMFGGLLHWVRWLYFG